VEASYLIYETVRHGFRKKRPRRTQVVWAGTLSSKEHTAKTRAADGSTHPTLLREVSDWQDHDAWVSFRRRYEPLLRSWCRGYGLDNDSVDEVCQCI